MKTTELPDMSHQSLVSNNDNDNRNTIIWKVFLARVRVPHPLDWAAPPARTQMKKKIENISDAPPIRALAVPRVGDPLNNPGGELARN